MKKKSIVGVADFLRQHLERRRASEFAGIWKVPKRSRALVVIEACKANVVFGGFVPGYDPGVDMIILPKPSWYRSFLVGRSASRFATDALHELVHWTGHEKRLGRPPHKQEFDALYAREELAAELGAVLLARDLGVSEHSYLPHAHYLNAYLSGVENSELELSIALTAANRAVGFVKSLARESLS